VRALLVLVVLGGVAAADARRECYLHAPAVKVKDLGCYDDLGATEDHTYGTRVCLVRTGTTCSGVLWEWQGGPEGKAYILDSASCSAKGKISFSVQVSGTARSYLYTFKGALARKVLRGTFTMDGEKHKVAWRYEPDGFDALKRIRTLTAKACSDPPATP
jgi:hypothetical protein